MDMAKIPGFFSCGAVKLCWTLKRGPVQRPYDFQNDVCSKFTQHVTEIDIPISSYESESERKKRKEKEETDRPSVNRGKQM